MDFFEILILGISSAVLYPSNGALLSGAISGAVGWMLFSFLHPLEEPTEESGLKNAFSNIKADFLYAGKGVTRAFLFFFMIALCAFGAQIGNGSMFGVSLGTILGGILAGYFFQKNL